MTSASPERDDIATTPVVGGLSPLHAAARELAQAGIKIFPCVPGDKKPACEHGFKDASADLAQIDAWWSAEPNANIGICPEDAGWAVVDLDPGSEAGWIKAMQQHGGHDATYEVETPRGGKHLYFRGSLPSTASKIAPHADTRGIGGYVLVPPSVVNGKSYVVRYDRDIAELPAWLPTLLAAKVSKIEGEDGPTDTASAIARATDYLKGLVRQGDIAISGRGGNDRTFKLFTWLKDLGVDRDTAVAMVTATGGWNDACRPPWPMGELSPIAEHAYKYSQNSAGTNDIGSAADAFANTEAFKQAMAASKPANDDEHSASRFRLIARAEYRDLPPPSWLIPNLLPQQGVALLVGHSQSLKSFIALDIAAAVASGSPAFNSVQPRQRGAVIFIAGEGSHGIKAQRVPALEKARRCDLSAAPLYIVENTPQVIEPEQVEELAAEIVKGVGSAPVRLIVVDTLATAMGGLDENDASKMGLATAAAGMLAKRFACLVLLVHHLPKAASGDEANPRGSGALFAAADTVLLATRAKDVPGVATRLSVAKAKDSDLGAPIYLEGEAIEVGRNAEGQAVTSLVLHTTTREAVESAADDLFGDVRCALERLEARDDRSAVSSQRLAREIARLEFPDMPEDGFALRGDPAARVKSLVELLRRCTVDPKFRGLVKRRGLSKTSPWIWSLPPEEAFEVVS